MQTLKHCALGLMAKAPLAGAVKTRLVPPLTPEEAAELNRCFLRDMATSISEITVRQNGTGFVVYTPLGAEAMFREMLPAGFNLLGQQGESLGDRLSNATRDLLALGFDSLCLINSDSPTLPQSVIDSAVAALLPEGDRIVIGGAADGGYYLIGLKQVHPKLFERIAWSTDKVLIQTLERADTLGLEIELLRPWYDVDDALTLEQLCEELFLAGPQNGNYPAPYTRRYLAQLIESGRIFPKFAGRTTS